MDITEIDLGSPASVQEFAEREISEIIDEIGPQDTNDLLCQIYDEYPDLAHLPYIDIGLIIQKVDLRVMQEKRENIYSKIPEGFGSGAEYTTPTKLVESGITRYTENHIRSLIHEGKLPGTAQIGRQIILNADAVERIRELERQKIVGQLVTPGMKPGHRFKPTAKRTKRRTA